MKTFYGLWISIRTSERPALRRLFRAMRSALYFHLSYGRRIGLFLFSLRVVVIYAWKWFLKAVWYEPLLRARCSRVGRNLMLYGPIPWIVGEGEIEIGDDVEMMKDTLISFASHPEKRRTLSIGDSVCIGVGARFSVAESISIGSHSMIGSNCFIYDNDGHPMDPEARRRRDRAPLDEIKPVVLEGDNWVGNDCVICKGVTIGRGSIVGTGSIVRRNVPPYTIVVGNPARPTMKLTADSGSDQPGESKSAGEATDVVEPRRSANK